jgi:hypothetical protein
VSLSTANSGAAGVSGKASIETGTTSKGDSGMITLTTGDTLPTSGAHGKGGDIRALVGTGNSGAGGDVLVTAGEATQSTRHGGKVRLGERASEAAYQGAVRAKRAQQKIEHARASATEDHSSGLVGLSSASATED